MVEGDGGRRSVGMRLRDLGLILKNSVLRMKKHEGDALASEAAFNFAFSLFPLLLFVVTLIGIFSHDPAFVNTLLRFLADFVPEETLLLVHRFLLSLQEGNLGGQLSLSSVLILWPASRIFNAFIKATVRAYEAPGLRPGWKNRLLAVSLVLITGLFGTLAFLAMVLGPLFADLMTRLGINTFYSNLVEILRFPLSVLLVTPMFAVIYRLGPDLKEHPANQIWPGAFMATLLWITVSALFSAYVDVFADYQATYGALGGIIVLLTWLWLTSVAVVFGAEFNAVFGKWLRLRDLEEKPA